MGQLKRTSIKHTGDCDPTIYTFLCLDPQNDEHTIFFTHLSYVSNIKNSMIFQTLLTATCKEFRIQLTLQAVHLQHLPQLYLLPSKT